MTAKAILRSTGRCLAAGVAFHFKQWGEWAPVHGGGHGFAGHHFICERGHFDTLTADRLQKHNDGDCCTETPEPIARLGKKIAGGSAFTCSTFLGMI